MKRERTIIHWNREWDVELLKDLEDLLSRQRGARLKYLAALGLKAEREGFHLRGREPGGELAFPTHFTALASREPPAAAPVAAKPSRANPALKRITAGLLSLDG